MLKMFINTKIKVNNSFYLTIKYLQNLNSLQDSKCIRHMQLWSLKKNFSKVIIEADVKKVIHQIRWEIIKIKQIVDNEVD